MRYVAGGVLEGSRRQDLTCTFNESVSRYGHRTEVDKGMYICFKVDGLSDLDVSSTSVERVLACDGSSPMCCSLDVGLWTISSSLGEAILPLADLVRMV